MSRQQNTKIILLFILSCIFIICMAFSGSAIANNVTYADSDDEEEVFAFTPISDTECDVRLLDKTVELAIVPSKATIDNVEYTVTSVASNGFASATNLRKVRLPNTVKTIGNAAFANCNQMTSITMPSVEEIGTNAFNLCSSLGYLIIPKSVQYVSSTILRNTTTQVYVRVSEEMTQELGWSETWNNYNSNQEVEYDSNFTPSIEYEEVLSTNSRTRSSEVVGYYVESAQPFSEKRDEDIYVYIPAEYNGLPIVGIADSAFTYNEITSIIVGYSDDPIYIESYAFNGVYKCSQIIINREINIVSEDGKISEQIFSDTDVASIVLPDTLTVIGDSMFQISNVSDIQFITPTDLNGDEQYKITITPSGEVNLPETVTYIGEEAFSGTNNISILSIPTSVVDVGARILVNWKLPQTVNLPYKQESDLPIGWNSSWSANCGIGVIQYQGTFSINYVLNGGSHSGNPTEYTSADTIILNDATLAGNTFEGWYDNESFSGDPITVISRGSSGDLTLYAKFVHNTYTIIYNSNIPSTALSSVIGVTVNSTHEYDVASPLSQNGYSLYGWEFVGWYFENSSTIYSDSQSVINLTDKANAVLTLYAEWSAKQYSVIYNANKPYNASGTLSGTMSDSVFKYDTTYTLTGNTYTLYGWSFTNWNTSSNGNGTTYSDEASVLNIPLNEGSEIILYAQWEANSYTVSYDANKPTNASHSVEGTMANSSHIYDTESQLNENTFTLYGWQFNGWNTKADGTGVYKHDIESVTDLGSNNTVILYAQWKAREYTIIYNSNRPTESSNNVLGELNNSVYTYDAESILRSNAFSLTGWTYSGWLDENGNFYSDGAIVKSPILDNSFMLNLYAQWTPYSYTVQYVLNAPSKADITGGSTASSSFKYDYSGTLASNGFTVTGWSFSGWNIKANGSGTTYKAGEAVINLDKSNITEDGAVITLYAQWEAILYTITLNANGGSGGTTSIQLYYGDPLPSATVPSRTGYTFKGYYYGTTEYYDSNMAVQITEWRDVNVTKIEANWEANKYTITFYKGSGEGGTDTLSVTYGKYPSQIEIPTRFGYNFIGYYYQGRQIDTYKYFDSNGNSTQIWYIASNGALYAYYEAVLTYNLNYWEQGGGIAAADTIKYNYNMLISIEVSISAPSYSGCTFVEWRHTPGYLSDTYDVLSTASTLIITESLIIDWLKSLSESGSTLSYNVYAYYTSNSCIEEGTLITLADGSQKAVQDLIGDEELLVWNLFTGTFDTAPILFIDSEPLDMYTVIALTFSDGTEVNVISEHAFWDFNLNKYVYLDKNASQYIGHWFNKQSIDLSGNLSWVKVQLISVDITEKYTTVWSPVTYSHLCYYVNGMLSMPGGISGLFNIFEVDSETLKYDETAMQADIEEYGLFSYEEFAEILPVSEAVFIAFNGQYLKVAIGKGLIDINTIKTLINRYENILENL